MSKYWKYFYLGYLVSLPHTLVGLLITLLFYKPQAWRWHDGCLECIAGLDEAGSTRIWGRPLAQTHGFLIVYASDKVWNSSRIRIHERCHVVQGFVGGPIYVILYGLFFLFNYIKTGCKDWYTAYRRNPFEEQAYSSEYPDAKKWGYEVR